VSLLNSNLSKLIPKVIPSLFSDLNESFCLLEKTQLHVDIHGYYEQMNIGRGT
jgi:hypothetical protein